MLIRVYSFYDKITKVYNSPVCDSQPIENLIEAYTRDMPRIVKDDSHLDKLKDKNLYLIGVFDDNTGKFIEVSNQLVLDFDNLILNALGGVE